MSIDSFDRALLRIELKELVVSFPHARSVSPAMTEKSSGVCSYPIWKGLFDALQCWPAPLYQRSHVSRNVKEYGPHGELVNEAGWGRADNHDAYLIELIEKTLQLLIMREINSRLFHRRLERVRNLIM